MIDQDAFNIEWAVLCERFNRDPSQVLAARYYQALSPQMSTAEFKAAARKVFEEREFFPRPADFLEAARPSVEAEAQEQWSLCDRVMRGSDGALAKMSPAGRKTVALLGGPTALRNTPLDEVHFRRSEFLRLFADAEEIHRRESQHQVGPSPDEARRIVAGNLRLVPGGRE